MLLVLQVTFGFLIARYPGSFRLTSCEIRQEVLGDAEVLVVEVMRGVEGFQGYLRVWYERRLADSPM